MKLEILEANYWEHFKFAKELAMFLPVNHPQRIKIDSEIDIMLKRINEIKNNPHA